MYADWTRGVRGHAPWEKFWFIHRLWCILGYFGSGFICWNFKKCICIEYWLYFKNKGPYNTSKLYVYHEQNSDKSHDILCLHHVSVTVIYYVFLWWSTNLLYTYYRIIINLLSVIILSIVMWPFSYLTTFSLNIEVEYPL